MVILQFRPYLILISIFLLAGLLRFYDISNNPPGLYIDEIAIGNNAYSILKTGKDEYGINFPLFFKSYGDYKVPAYIYIVSGSMAFFGKNEFAIRFPSALAGTFSIIILYFILKELLKLDDKKSSDKKYKYLPILAAFLLTISPWHLQFSRGGFEVNFAVFLFLLASLLAVLYLRKKNFIFISTAYFFYILTIYTYDSYRALAPLVLTILTFLILWKIPKHRINVIMLGVLSFLLFFPIFQFSFTANGMARFSQTSAFVEYSASGILEKILIYPMVFIKNYFTYFSLDYLFNFGDGIGRHQIPGFGLLFSWQLPFIIIGLYKLFKEKKSYLTYFILGILLLSPVPGSFARPSPHTLRNLLSVVSFITLSSIGIIIFYDKIKIWKKPAMFLLSMIVIYYFLSYLHSYYVHYPNVNIYDWGQDNKQVVEESLKYSKKGYRIVIDERVSSMIYYFNFYAVENYTKPKVIFENWTKPKEWGTDPVLYIRPYYGIKSPDGLVENIILPNPNHDIRVQFYKL